VAVIGLVLGFGVLGFARAWWWGRLTWVSRRAARRRQR
jgi:hypothetical protein